MTISRKRDRNEPVCRIGWEELLDRCDETVRLPMRGFIRSYNLQVAVAVMAVDPSSSRSGGSILGDKTRMERLATDPQAFIRPSPAGGTLGGVARKTRETLLLFEAAGYDVILVETIGVGQSEITVRSMVDFFLLVLVAGAGDELQGLKKGIMEIADAVLINKADGEQKATAQRTRDCFAEALHLLRSRQENWTPRVLAASALTGEGIEEFWSVILMHRELLTANGELEARRRSQARAWLWRLVRDGLEASFRADPAVAETLARLERQVEENTCTAPAAASLLFNEFGRRITRA